MSFVVSDKISSFIDEKWESYTSFQDTLESNFRGAPFLYVDVDFDDRGYDSRIQLLAEVSEFSIRADRENLRLIKANTRFDCNFFLFAGEESDILFELESWWQAELDSDVPPMTDAEVAEQSLLWERKASIDALKSELAELEKHVTESQG